MDAASMAIQFLPSDLRESLIVEHLLAEIFSFPAVALAFVNQVSATGDRSSAKRRETC
jgi:hypothetical protein